MHGYYDMSVIQKPVPDALFMHEDKEISGRAYLNWLIVKIFSLYSHGNSQEFSLFEARKQNVGDVSIFSCNKNKFYSGMEVITSFQSHVRYASNVSGPNLTN